MGTEYSNGASNHKKQVFFLISIKIRFSFETNSNKLISSIINTKQNLKEIRRNNPIQGILWSETLRSHEKLSKYIREKRKKIA